MHYSRLLTGLTLLAWMLLTTLGGCQTALQSLYVMHSLRKLSATELRTLAQSHGIAYR